jgi:alkanesulfonate monooxygenase SsuD/methylene tetrahydromethanopterin reductase-like flavin-dependent oxidoreductase (luciferase family)
METRRDVIVALAQEAERAGYSAFFVGEGWGHDAGVLLSEVALRTRHLTLGTGVLNVWGRSAGGIALLATSLDDVSGGRFVLGLGAGSPALAEGLHDVAFHAPVRRLGTVTRQVRRLLDGEGIEPTAASGVRPVRLAVRPERAVPIHLAALGTAAVRLTGETADGWCPFLLPRSQLGGRRALLNEAADAAGRPAPVAVNPSIPLAVSPDAEAAAELTDWWLRFYLTRMGPLYPRMLRDAGLGEAVDQVIAGADADRSEGRTAPPPELADEVILTGHPAAVEAALTGWREAGADMPILVLPPGRPLDTLLDMIRSLAPGTA